MGYGTEANRCSGLGPNHAQPETFLVLLPHLRKRPKNPQCLGVQLLFLPYFICPLSCPVLSCSGRSLAHSQMATGLLSGGRAGVYGPLWAFCTMCCNRPGSGDARTCMHVNVCVPKTRGPTQVGSSAPRLNSLCSGPVVLGTLSSLTLPAAPLSICRLLWPGFLCFGGGRHH